MGHTSSVPKLQHAFMVDLEFSCRWGLVIFVVTTVEAGALEEQKAGRA